MIKHLRKFLSSFLIFALLTNTMVSTGFAQFAGQMNYKDFIPELDFKEEVVTETVGDKINKICNNLALCLELNGQSLEGVKPGVNLLYQDLDYIEGAIRNEYPEQSVGMLEDLVLAVDIELTELRKNKEEAKRLWASGNVKGEDRVKFLYSVVPALYIADSSDNNFYEYFAKEYDKYLKEKEEELIKLAKKGKIDEYLEDTGSEETKEFIGIGRIIMGYSMFGGYPKLEGDRKRILYLALNLSTTMIAPVVVMDYVSILLENEEYEELKKYLKILSYHEGVNSEGNYKDNAWGAVIAGMDLYMAGTHIKNNKAYQSKYAPGPVSQSGYYLGENNEIENIWQILPQVIVDIGGEKGVEVINDLFYNGLEVGNGGTSYKPNLFWKRGAIIPFIIGSIGTNKIKAHPELVKTGSITAIQDYYNANIVGLVEIGLLDYRFYDVPNYEYYRKVREVLREPYIGIIEAEKGHREYIPSRSNFSVYNLKGQRNAIFGDETNPYLGMLYHVNEKRGIKEGALLNYSKENWETNKALLGRIIQVSNVLDIALAIYYSYQIGKLVYSIGPAISQNIKLLRIARVARAGGHAGELMQIMRGIKRDPAYFAAVIKEIEISKATRNLEKMKGIYKKSGTAYNRARLESSAAELAKLEKELEVLKLKLKPEDIGRIRRELAAYRGEGELSEGAQAYVNLEESQRAAERALAKVRSVKENRVMQVLSNDEFVLSTQIEEIWRLRNILDSEYGKVARAEYEKYIKEYNRAVKQYNAKLKQYDKRLEAYLKRYYDEIKVGDGVIYRQKPNKKIPPQTERQPEFKAPEMNRDASFYKRAIERVQSLEGELRRTIVEYSETNSEILGTMDGQIERLKAKYELALSKRRETKDSKVALARTEYEYRSAIVEKRLLEIKGDEALVKKINKQLAEYYKDLDRGVKNPRLGAEASDYLANLKEYAKIKYKHNRDLAEIREQHGPLTWEEEAAERQVMRREAEQRKKGEKAKAKAKELPIRGRGNGPYGPYRRLRPLIMNKLVNPYVFSWLLFMNTPVVTPMAMNTVNSIEVVSKFGSIKADPFTFSFTKNPYQKLNLLKMEYLSRTPYPQMMMRREEAFIIPWYEFGRKESIGASVGRIARGVKEIGPSVHDMMLYSYAQRVTAAPVRVAAQGSQETSEVKLGVKPETEQTPFQIIRNPLKVNGIRNNRQQVINNYWKLSGVAAAAIAMSFTLPDVMNVSINSLNPAPLLFASAPLLINSTSLFNPDIKLSPRVQKFLQLRGNFNTDLFKGQNLSKNEALHMKEILGEDFFNLWQTYYNQDLEVFAHQNPQAMEELIKYSNRYESTLKSQIDYRFGGTNPLYVFAMKDMTENFEKDLLAGKSIKEAVINMGKPLFLYHKKINQIKAFFSEYNDSGADRILWDYVETPWDYGNVYKLNEYSAPSEFFSSRINVADRIAFGVLGDSPLLIITPFSENGYGEYWTYFLDVENRPDTFKGVNLTTFNLNQMLGTYLNGVMVHPLGIKEDGFNNIDAMFDVIQADYDAIQPLIMRARNGETLTASETETLHNTISEISYLFTNAKPFLRGSASANLAIVYGLYEMAGIKAPQVKIGRALDLSAFVTTPQEYQANWLNMFDGKFKPIVTENQNLTTPTSTSLFKIKNWLLPSFGIGLGLTMLLNGIIEPTFALASIPFLASLKKPTLTLQSSNVQSFIDLRKRFDAEIFQGPELSAEEAKKMKEILGKDTFNEWQKFFNKDLAQMAISNPDLIQELIKYSNRYETTLPSQTKYSFPSTNPLYVHDMKVMTEGFEKDLLAGKSFKDAVVDMGFSMFTYHKRNNQIRTFFNEQKNSKIINWGKVEEPSYYDRAYDIFRGGSIAYAIGFGILEAKDTGSRSYFSRELYGEYWKDLHNTQNRPENYKGVNLSSVLIEENVKGEIKHPISIPQKGINNIEALFNAIQENYNTIKPIIMKARNGQVLSATDLQILHSNIAEISYLFTNAKPFYRGSASANLNIVYGLYHMAGIEAPQVKIGRALDLSAFALTPEDYIKEWTNLFDGEFQNINSGIKYSADNISAKVLFTGSYMKDSRPLSISRITQMVNFPSDFVESNAIYRGMLLSSYDDLKDIFKKGLLTSRTNTGNVYFATRIDDVLDYATRFDNGKISVVIKMESNKASKSREFIPFNRDIKPNEISEVLVWANIDNKVGWYKAGADEFGEIVLQPTDAVETVTAPATSNFSFRNMVMPAIGIGLGLTALLNGSAESTLALASIPFFAGFNKQRLIQKKKVSDFIDLRKGFDQGIFQGPELSAEEAKKMKEILGKDTFNEWQKYYNQDLSQFANENTSAINDIINASNRYETTLPSLIYYRFKGTNPLFLNEMSQLSNFLKQNLLKDVPLKRALVDLGNQMYDYHKDIFRIQIFLEYKKKNTAVDWKYIQNPPIYPENFEEDNNFDLAEDIGYGKLNDYFGAGLKIDRGMYGEYLLEAVYAYNHPESYKGVRLPFIDRIDKSGFYMLYANGTNPDGNNNDIAFIAMQSDFDQIKPLILKAQAGTKLTELELKTLHENIADISYIFTNAVPFYRGTSAANLALVYTLYDMAGIQAPQVRIGRQLDLTAFITTPDDYKKQWLMYLFDGDFVQTGGKPLDLKTEIKKADIVTYTGAEGQNSYIWQLKDAYGNTDAYFEYATPNDVKKFKLLDRTVRRGNLAEKFNLIDFEYPKLLSTRSSSLPKEVIGSIENDVKDDIAFVAARDNELTESVILSPITSSGLSLKDMGMDNHTFRHGMLLGNLNLLKAEGLAALRNSPITTEEWEQVVGLFQSLDNFYLGNLDKVFLSRDPSGKLVVGILDLGYGEEPANKYILSDISFKLEMLGLKFDRVVGESRGVKSDSHFYHPKAFHVKNLLMPAIGIGLSLTALINNTVEPSLALASIPFLASLKKPTLTLQSSNVQSFIDLRKRFDAEIFQGPELSAEEAKKMKEILGKDTFNEWQKFFNKDLAQMAISNPDLIQELIKYSNRYENTLRSIISHRFDGTNPLFFYHMKDLSDTFAKNLLSGKSIKEAVIEMGNEIFKYHKRINQISAFLDYKKSRMFWINWANISTPKYYGYSNGKYSTDIGFGVFKRPGRNFGLSINPISYSEYLDRSMYEYSHPKDNFYKGVNLTYFYQNNRRDDEVLLLYPNVYNDSGEENNNYLFVAMQEDWEHIKPIIEKHQSGQELTKADINILHENIADISYLFANAVPFYRGSASANLAMVYGLYEAAGIEAPQVKIGKALDLEAFITTPEQYKENWKDLFNGEFQYTPIKNQDNIVGGDISAKVLFSGEHKTDLSISQEDSKEIMQYLPSGFLEENTIYRGMRFSVNSYEDLETVLKVGLLTNKTQGVETIFFSPSVEMAIDYAKRVKEGEIPILVKMPYKQPNSRREEYNSLIDNSGIRTAPPSNEVFFSEDIEASKLSGVLVWAELDGKRGWWKAAVNGNGEIILQPTDNMQIVTAPKVKTESTPKLSNYLMPAIIGGLGLTMLLSGNIAPTLALASLPLLASTRPIINQTNGIPAKVLFTDEYKKKDVKFFYKDVDRIINSLPSDFEGNDAIYRGMTLDKFEDLKRILIKGLQVNKSNYNYIYFSKEIETAIDYAAEYDYGHLPIIVKMCSDYYSKLGPVVKYSSDISASDIDEVIVWAELDGKLGWWKAVLDNNGEVVLQPTDNMITVETPTVSSVSTKSTEKLLNLKKDIARAVPFEPLVIQLVNSEDEIKAYYKRATEEEVERTQTFDKIITKMNVEKEYPLLVFEYPKVLSTDLSDLPKEVAAEIKSKYYNKELSANMDMIMTAVNTSGYNLYVSQDNLTSLHGQPITNEEWEQIVSFIKNLNKVGFYHTDLKYNLFFRRDDNGKLVITIIDFENLDWERDIRDLGIIAHDLESIGAKEKPVSASAEKPLNLKTDITKATQVDGFFVMELIDSQDNIRAYYKRTTEEEIDRTNLFDKIVKENNLQNKYSLIDFEYPRILSTDLASLPQEVARIIEGKFNGSSYPISYDARNPFGMGLLLNAYSRIRKMNADMIVSPVNTSGFVLQNKLDYYTFEDGDVKIYGDVISERKDAMKALKNQPITVEEWSQIEQFIIDLNKTGFYHTDLIHNLFFRRDDNDKLVITLIDFEILNDEEDRPKDDMSDLNRIRTIFDAINVKYQ